MDLRSPEPFWPLHDPPQRQYPALSGRVECDVAIIGAGASGAMAAYELSRAGLRVVVVDSRQPGRGSTAASTALLMYDLDTPLHELSAMMGEDAAARCYCMGVQAIERIAQITAALKDDCGYERRPSLLAAESEKDAAELECELVARREAGIDVRGLSRAEVSARYSLSAAGALWSPHAAQVDSYRLTHALLADACDHGARVFAGTRVELPTGGPPFSLRGESGEVVAPRIVVAGGFESAAVLGIPLAKKPTHENKTQGGEAPEQLPRLLSTFAVATTPVAAFRGWEDRALIWQTARPYLYMRTTTDGRVMLGGADEPTTDPDERNAMVQRKARELMREFRRMFPKIKAEAEYAWAGFFIETPDGLPYIGAVPGREGVYMSLCYGGNGTTFAATGARVLRELVVDGHSADAALLGLERARGAGSTPLIRA